MNIVNSNHKSRITDEKLNKHQSVNRNVGRIFNTANALGIFFFFFFSLSL